MTIYYQYNVQWLTGAKNWSEFFTLYCNMTGSYAYQTDSSPTKTYNGGNKVKKMKKILSSLLICTLILSMTLITGCSKKGGSENSKKLAVTVGDSKIYLDEMMYYIFMNEYQLDQYDQMYKAYMGTSYWDMEYSEGVTMRDFAKTSTMDMAVQYEILYTEAKKAGYKLTKEEKDTIPTNVDQFMGVITEEQTKKTGLTKEVVEKILEKLMVTSRYIQDTIDKFDIDDEGIKAAVNKDELRQYNTEALYISTSTVDDKGQSKEFTKDEKADAKKKLEAVLEKAKGGDDFAKIVEGKEEIQNQQKNFVVGQGAVSEEYEKLAKGLKNDEVTDVVEAADGYYIIKMVNNNSDEAYQAQVEQKISEEEQKQFEAEYEKIKKDYKITINDEVWDGIVMGETTLIQPEETKDGDNAAGQTSDDNGGDTDKKDEDKAEDANDNSGDDKTTDESKDK